MTRPPRSWLSLLVIALIASAGCQPTPTPAPRPSSQSSQSAAASTSSASSATPTADVALSEPRFSLDEAVREHFTIATGTNVDSDPKPDVIAFDVIRPNTSEKVAVIANASPYNEVSKGGEKWVLDKAGRPQLMPRFVDNFFVPRGYAVVSIDNLGTGRSSGCGDEYSGPRVRAAMQLVMAFLAGEASAHDSTGRAVTATWSNGAVGMIGGSAEGTIPLSIASTGDPHLKAVVSFAGMADQLSTLSYFGAAAPWDMSGAGTFNATGTPRQTCTAADAALTKAANAAGNDPQGAFWVERRTLPTARWKAATLLVSGQRDDVVPGSQAALVWRGLTEFDIERAWWIHQGGHDDPFNIDRARWVETVHLWFDHFLLGKTGVAVATGVRVQNADLTWSEQSSFPMPEASAHSWTMGTTLTQASAEVTGTVATLGTAEPNHEFGEAPETNRYFRQPLTPMPQRVVALTEPLAEPMHLSGSPTVVLKLRPSSDNVSVAVALVDVGEAQRPVRKGTGLGFAGPVGGKDCWGEKRQTTLDTGVKLNDTACYDKSQLVLASSPAGLISRTAAGPVPPASAQGWSSVELTLDPIQQVIPAGHRLAIMVGINDPISGFYENSTLTVGTSQLTLLYT